MSQYGCDSIHALHITIHPNPDPNITTNSTTICDGSSTELTATGGINYEWTLPAGSVLSTQVITVNQAGIYELSVIDENGCSSNINQLITVLSLPVIEGIEGA